MIRAEPLARRGGRRPARARPRVWREDRGVDRPRARAASRQRRWASRRPHWPTAATGAGLGRDRASPAPGGGAAAQAARARAAPTGRQPGGCVYSLRFVATRGVVHAVAPARRVGNRWASGRARRCRYPVAGYAVGADGRRPPRTGTLDWYVPRLILEFLMQFLASCVAGTPSGRPARPGRRRHRAPRGPGLVHGPAPQGGRAHAAVRPKVPSGLRATAAPFLICFFRSSRASAVLQLSRYTVNRSFPTTPNAERALFSALPAQQRLRLLLDSGTPQLHG